MVSDNGHKIALVSVGTMQEECLSAIQGKEVSLFDGFCIKPIDRTMFEAIFSQYSAVIIVEEGQIIGGFGSSVLQLANELNYNGIVRTLGIPDVFVGHASISEQRHSAGIDASTIRQTIEDILLTIN
jgi:1-deoxy-D-xylulose-5-phosphate synthase